jgi:ABC-2 type transport system ATP-binding protein
MIDTNLSSPAFAVGGDPRAAAATPGGSAAAGLTPSTSSAAFAFPSSSSVPSFLAPAAQLRAVTRRYGKVVALDQLDLALAPGEIVALLGPNGAGKSTAVSLLLGLAQPDGGAVEVLGGDPRATAVRCQVGAMLQTGAVPQTLKVREHLELAAAWYGDPVPLAEVVALAGLEGLEERLYGKLSGGQQRRVLFAMALCGAPRLLVLDEPTVALDVEARRALWARVRQLAAAGAAVLLTTHDLAEAAALATRVVVIHRGRKVADGTPAEVASVVGQRRIVCRTTLEAALVAGWPEVAHVERMGARLAVTARPALAGEVDPLGPATAPAPGLAAGAATGPAASPPVTENLVRRLLAADPELCELEVAGASLEDALLALTGLAAEPTDGVGSPAKTGRSEEVAA